MEKSYGRFRVSGATVLAALAVMVTAACGRLADQPVAACDFVAEVEVGGTRTALAASGDAFRVDWSAGDMIAVTDGERTAIYKTMDSGTPTATFTFLGGNEPDGEIHACYPSTIRKELPQVQNYCEGNIAAAPMHGIVAGNHISFKNLCSILKLDISSNSQDRKIKSIEITADKPLSGAYSVENDAAVISEGKGVTLDCGAGVAIGTAPVPFHISIPAGTYTGICIKMTATDGKTSQFKMADRRAVIFERSKLYETVFPFENPNDTIDISKCRIVAHRGLHTSAPENSLAALRAAQALGVWGSEFDIWVTTDNRVVVNHNSTFSTDPAKTAIQTHTFADLTDIRLSNGEIVPTLESFLDEGLKRPDVKLVCEIKSHSQYADTKRCFDEAIKLVRERKMEEQMVWISFSWDLCRYIRAKEPTAQIQYICQSASAMKTPLQLKAAGINGSDYTAALYNANPKFYREAHKNGIVTNVWTIDNTATALTLMRNGVDFVTTNKPKEIMASILIDNGTSK